MKTTVDASKFLAYCAIATLIALYIVGAVSNGILRHIVQTLPLWFLIIMGLRRREVVKWAALPCFAVWLTLMTLIWLFLLGWAKVVSGQFTPVEVALTLIVGIANLAGLITGIRWRTSQTWTAGLAVTVLFTAIQLAAVRLSFLPAIAKDRW